jgi:lysophospholipase L1-like esterase
MSPGYGEGLGGYAPLVAEALKPHGVSVIWMTENTSNTRTFLKLLEGGEMPLIVELIQFNAGLHDIIVRDDQAGCSVPLEEYRDNLRAIIRAFRLRTSAALVWASTTPVIDAMHLRVKGFARREADVLRYNRAAAEVMSELDVPVHDLHSVLMESRRADTLEEKLYKDGVHMADIGRTILAEAVSALVLQQLGGAPQEPSSCQKV